MLCNMYIDELCMSMERKTTALHTSSNIWPSRAPRDGAGSSWNRTGKFDLQQRPASRIFVFWKGDWEHGRSFECLHISRANCLPGMDIQNFWMLPSSSNLYSIHFLLQCCVVFYFDALGFALAYAWTTFDVQQFSTQKRSWQLRCQRFARCTMPSVLRLTCAMAGSPWRFTLVGRKPLCLWRSGIAMPQTCSDADTIFAKHKTA